MPKKAKEGRLEEEGGSLKWRSVQETPGWAAQPNLQTWYRGEIWVFEWEMLQKYFDYKLAYCTYRAFSVLFGSVIYPKKVENSLVGQEKVGWRGPLGILWRPLPPPLWKRDASFPKEKNLWEPFNVLSSFFPLLFLKQGVKKGERVGSFKSLLLIIYLLLLLL